MTEDLKEKNNDQAKKFLFDQNNFNDDFVEEEPEPTYSQAELAAEKQKGIEEGRASAFQEAKESREQALLGLMGNMVGIFNTFLTQEDERAALYEKESLKLTLETIKILFPELNKRHGVAEIQGLIEESLKNKKIESDIKIEVAETALKDIESYFDKHIKPQLHTNADIIITARPGFGLSDCSISWDDGGADRKASIISAKILDKLQRPLADMPEVSDNEDTDDHRAKPIPDDTHSSTIENDPVNDEENEITEKSDE